MLVHHELAIWEFRPRSVAVNVELARLIASREHRGQVLSTGERLMDHVSRVAAATPEFARPVAWLHEVLERTSVSEEELLVEGVSDDELRALRLLTRTPGRGSDSGYLAHITLIARAGGPAGDLARAVKVSDLQDRLRHPGPGLGGARPPYEQALRLLLADAAAQGLPASGARLPAA